MKYLVVGDAMKVANDYRVVVVVPHVLCKRTTGGKETLL